MISDEKLPILFYREIKIISNDHLKRFFLIYLFWGLFLFQENKPPYLKVIK